MSESYILCEGYHDRAFWAGLLLHLGCIDPSTGADGRRVTVFDPWSLPVRGSGEFAFLSRSGQFVRIVPAGGKDKVRPLAMNRLKARDQKRLTRLVLTVDDDTVVAMHGTPVFPQAAVEQLARDVDPLSIENGGEFLIDGGSTRITPVRWLAGDPATAGVPAQQTLERLICAAMVAAYPARGDCVQRWLDSRPDSPQTTPKAFSWSYLAGWHSDMGGYEAFIGGLWLDGLIASELRSRLERDGIWAIAEAMAS